MPDTAPRWVLFRGRLVRRLMLVFVLSGSLPVLVACAVAYGELVRTMDRQQERALREDAKSTAMNLLGQLQLAEAALKLPPPRDFRPRELPGGLGRILYERIRSTADLPEDSNDPNVSGRSRLLAGETVLSWEQRKQATPDIVLLRFDAEQGYLARARIDIVLLAQVAVMSGQETAIALSSVTDDMPLYDSHGIAGAARQSRWKTAQWELPLESLFASQPLRITIGAPHRSVAAELGLLKLVVPLALAAAVAMAVWFSIALLRRHLKPLETLTAATRRIAQRDFNVRLDINTGDEFAQLAGDFNDMALNLQSQFSTLESVAEVDRQLLRAPTLPAILDTLLPRIADVLGADRVSVLLEEPGSSQDVQVHDHWLEAPAPRTVRHLRIGHDWAAASGAAVDERSHLQLAQQVFNAGAGARVRFLTLQHKQRVVGLLGFHWAAGSTSRLPDKQLESGFADRLSVALANLSHQQELLHRARFDGLTGLANRDYFMEELDARIASTRDDSRNTALLYIDLDEFKKINDSAGHDAGDQVLIEIAGRLRDCVGPADLVARLGGDEFAIIVGASDDPCAPEALGAQVRRALQLPVTVSGLARPMSASIGLARIPGDGDSSEALLRNADIAMYSAKGLGRDQLAAFSPLMLAQMNEHVSIEMGLQHAIQRGELDVHFQPIVGANGMVISAEALLRWTRQDGETVSPAIFIPVAEQSGLINIIGLWSLKCACVALAAWRRAGSTLAYVSVNVAPRQLHSDDFLAAVMRTVGECRLRPADLQLEITESAIGESQRARAMIHMLSDHGFRIAMDDFGTGYSSLSHLHEYPFAVVKVDRSFVARICDGVASMRIVDAIIRMAHGLQMRVVAEGVETVDQQAALLELGCEAMQGYLFGKAVDADAFGRHLRAVAANSPAEPRMSIEGRQTA